MAEAIELLDSLNREISPSGRFRLCHASELMSPAKCVICGVVPANDETPPMIGATSENEEFKSVETAAGEHFLDGNLVFEWYGTVYFCCTCTLEMAYLFGAIGPEQVRQLFDATQLVIQERNDLRTAVAEMESSQNALMAGLLRSRGVDINDVLGTPEPEVAEPTSEIPAQAEEDNRDSISEEPVGEVPTGEPEISEFISEQRRPDLLDPTATDDFLNSI